MKRIRRMIFLIDDIIHVIIAIFLIFVAFFFLYEAVKKMCSMEYILILKMVGDLLFVLLVMEILWEVLRYLRRKAFTLKPFIYIGIIASIRGIVLTEAKISLDLESDILFSLLKIGIFSIIILFLVLSLYILGKIPQRETEE